jgi:hypothetical protein
VLDSQTFLTSVWPEIDGRWTSATPATPQVRDDWYEVMKRFTAKQAADLFRRFIRQYEKRGMPRTGEFSAWVAGQGNDYSDKKGFRFPFDIPNWPDGAVMVRCSGQHRKNDVVLFGWVERRERQDELYCWIREYDRRWNVRTLSKHSSMPQVQKIGDAPESWYRRKSLMPDEPEGLAELMAREF